ncbi:hypothetical protein I1H34_01360 [Acaryochloris marina S15]|nr:hypothetical protein I1H34_01360 [Acaryochloris marina S15]
MSRPSVSDYAQSDGVGMPNLRFIFPSPPAMRYLKSQPLTLSVLQAHPP